MTVWHRGHSRWTLPSGGYEYVGGDLEAIAFEPRSGTKSTKKARRAGVRMISVELAGGRERWFHEFADSRTAGAELARSYWPSLAGLATRRMTQARRDILLSPARGPS